MKYEDIQRWIIVGMTTIWLINIALHWLTDYSVITKFDFTILIAFIIYLLWDSYFANKRHSNTLDMWGESIKKYLTYIEILQTEIKFLKKRKRK